MEYRARLIEVKNVNNSELFIDIIEHQIIYFFDIVSQVGNDFLISTVTEYDTEGDILPMSWFWGLLIQECEENNITYDSIELLN